MLRDFNPDEVVVPHHPHPTAPARDLINAAGAKLRVLSATETVTHGDFSIALAPTRPLRPLFADPNQQAIVLYCESDQAAGLLSGDVPGDLLFKVVDGEKWTFARRKRFYKVTHHCSDTGCSSQLMALLAGGEAVTSCGLPPGRYGHPHPKAKALVDAAVVRGGHRLTYSEDHVSFQM